MTHFLLSCFALMVLSSALAHADTDTVAVQGYDVVSYHQDKGIPVKGSGNSVSYHNGATYLFASDANKKAFEANPEKYVPAYGGYCAFGVSKGKKYVSDALAYKIVDGTLYLNLNQDVQAMWVKAQASLINDADKNWEQIKDTPAAGL